MVNIDIKVAIGENIKHDLNNFQVLQNNIIKDTLVDIANEFINTIQFLSPRDTGEYANSWAIQNIDSRSVTIGTPLEELAAYLEYGTSPHPIVGHRKVLHWVGEDGLDHFAFYVRHPGFPAIPHIRPTINVLETKIPEIIMKNMKKHFRLVK